MKKLSIDRPFIIQLILLCVSLVVTILFIGGATIFDHKDGEYRAMLGERYGTTEMVHARSHNRASSLWYGEPSSAYIYTGYVGYGMTDEDVKNIEILATGAPAEEAAEVLDRLYTGWTTCAFLALIMVGADLYLIFGVVGELVRKFENSANAYG